MQSVHIMDVVFIAIVLLCIANGYRRGLVKSVFGLFSVIIALVIANRLYPIVSGALRQVDFVYSGVKTWLIDRLGLYDQLQDQTLAAQNRLIEELPLPGFITDLLLNHNNAELYRLFDVSAVEDFIAGYIANMLLNTLALVLTFVLALLIMRLIGKSLNIVSKIPVIGQLDRLGGALCGVVSGILLVWVIVAVGVLLLTTAAIAPWVAAANESWLAFIFFDSNLILRMIGEIQA